MKVQTWNQTTRVEHASNLVVLNTFSVRHPRHNLPPTFFFLVEQIHYTRREHILVSRGRRIGLGWPLIWIL